MTKARSIKFLLLLLIVLQFGLTEISAPRLDPCVNDGESRPAVVDRDVDETKAPIPSSPTSFAEPGRK